MLDVAHVPRATLEYDEEWPGEPARVRRHNSRGLFPTA